MSAATRGVRERIVATALEEDLGRGDITTDACVPEDTTGEACFRARESLVVAGLEVLREVYRQVDPAVDVVTSLTDGARARPGDVLATVRGPARAILAGERVALNFLSHLSGVASATARYVDAIPEGKATRISDTRKTTPGLRALEREAVRAGGGHNHRNDLSAGVLIKDNHIASSGGVSPAIERARHKAPHASRVECEVDTLDQLREAIDAGADAVLLDNFSDEDVRVAVELVSGRAVVEASGGITVDRVSRLAMLGVDVISVGAITHSAPSVDIGLDWS